MSREPVNLSLPPFFGFIRKLVLAAAVAWGVSLVLPLVNFTVASIFLDHLFLHPGDVLHEPWQLATYPFVPQALLSVLFALLSVWFFGAELELARGTRWMRDYFLVATIGGATLCTLLSVTVFRHVDQLGPMGRVGSLWPFVLALALTYARLFPERELRLYFVLRVKAKYLAALYVLVYLAETITTGQRLDAMLALCVGLCGFLFLRFGPRRGTQVAGSEAWFGLRNRWARAKRRRAAKQFTVYMRKQGRDVNLDASGKYVSLEDEHRNPDDPRWRD